MNGSSKKSLSIEWIQLIFLYRFLYKMNLMKKSQAYDKTELTNVINERHQIAERFTRSTFEEVSQFLQTVHQDFESFLKKHKKEHAELNTKVTQLQSMVDGELHAQVSEVRGVVEAYATVISCLVEFSNLEQALSL